MDPVGVSLLPEASIFIASWSSSVHVRRGVSYFCWTTSRSSLLECEVAGWIAPAVLFGYLDKTFFFSFFVLKITHQRGSALLSLVTNQLTLSPTGVSTGLVFSSSHFGTKKNVPLQPFGYTRSFEPYVKFAKNSMLSKEDGVKINLLCNQSLIILACCTKNNLLTHWTYPICEQKMRAKYSV